MTISMIGLAICLLGLRPRLFQRPKNSIKTYPFKAIGTADHKCVLYIIFIGQLLRYTDAGSRDVNFHRFLSLELNDTIQGISTNANDELILMLRHLLPCDQSSSYFIQHNFYPIT